MRPELEQTPRMRVIKALVMVFVSLSYAGVLGTIVFCVACTATR